MRKTSKVKSLKVFFFFSILVLVVALYSGTNGGLALRDSMGLSALHKSNGKSQESEEDVRMMSGTVISVLVSAAHTLSGVQLPLPQDALSVSHSNQPM